jgi:hypothetical protein
MAQPVRFCPSCRSRQINVAYGERFDADVQAKFISLDVYCRFCGWSGCIEPDVEEWEGDRWMDTDFIKL